MKDEGKMLDARSPDHKVYVLNMVTALMGGVSQLLVVCAPFGMAMSYWRSYSEIIITACCIGGFPLLCMSSIVLSRYLLLVESKSSAIVFATVPLFIGFAALIWAVLTS